jgi:hypothetical protein
MRTKKLVDIGTARKNSDLYEDERMAFLRSPGTKDNLPGWAGFYLRDVIAAVLGALLLIVLCFI